MTQEHEVPFTKLNEDITQTENDLPLFRLKSNESKILYNSEGQKTNYPMFFKGTVYFREPPQDYEVPISSVFSTDNSVILIPCKILNSSFKASINHHKSMK